PQLRRRLRRHGRRAAAQLRRAARSRVHLPMGGLRRRLQRRADAPDPGEPLRARAHRRRPRSEAGQLQLGPRQPRARRRARLPDRDLSRRVLRHRLAGGEALRRVPQDRVERQAPRRRVRLALAQPVGRVDRRRLQVPPSRAGDRPPPGGARPGLCRGGPMKEAARIGVARQLPRVGALVAAERRAYLAGLVFVTVSIGTALGYPYVIRLIIDDAIRGGDLARLNQLSLVMLGILIAEAIATWGRDYF